MDISINKLRSRVGIQMPPLQVIGGKPAVKGVVYDDPKRDPTIPSLLWEIIRERRVELIFEGFRLNDLRRWKKLDYTDTQKIEISIEVPGLKKLIIPEQVQSLKEVWKVI